GPSARWTKNGSPPTDLNARTGELTPPGSSACARLNRAWERWVLIRSSPAAPDAGARPCRGLRSAAMRGGGPVFAVAFETGAVRTGRGDRVRRVEHAADHRHHV